MKAIGGWQGKGKKLLHEGIFEFIDFYPKISNTFDKCLNNQSAVFKKGGEYGNNRRGKARCR